MARPVRRRPLTRSLLALAFAVTGLLGLAPGVAPAPVDALSRWTGGIDLYRTGVFTTQGTWLWCTAADVQIMRNIVDHQADHSATSQQRYFDYMRAHDRYWMPVSDGTEPSGWAAGLRRYVDSRYRMVASTSFDSALRSAVTNLRMTNLPVGLLVANGDHAWVLTGFSATADPARTSHFTVTSLRVTGPLWGLQSRSYGYDMPPDTRLTPAQLRTFFTPWHYARIRMAWEGRWVSIQGIPVKAATATMTRATSPAPRATLRSVAKTQPPSRAPSRASPEPGAAATPSPAVTPAPVAMPLPTSRATVTAEPLAVAPVVEPSTAPGSAAAVVLDFESAPVVGLGLALALVILLGSVSLVSRVRRTVTRD
jgi:hypothetical protein